MISVIGPCNGGRIFHALLAAQEEGGEPTKLPDHLVKEVGPKPRSYAAAYSSRHSGVWTEAIQAGFDGLEATFPETSEFSEGTQYCRFEIALEMEGRRAWHD